MKNLMIAVLVVMAVLLVGCGNGGPGADYAEEIALSVYESGIVYRLRESNGMEHIKYEVDNEFVEIDDQGRNEYIYSFANVKSDIVFVQKGSEWYYYWDKR